MKRGRTIDYMPAYRICNLVIESRVLLPELLLAPEGEVDYVFRLSRRVTAPVAHLDWYHSWLLPDGSVWLSIARRGPGFLLRFHGMADFQLSPDARRITCYARRGVPRSTVRHLLLDQVLPVILGHRGQLVLHAAAVALRAGAVAFLGETGRGKSTLSAGFCRQGSSLLTDDCFVVAVHDGGFLALPSYPGLRLWPETRASLFGATAELGLVAHYTSKERLSGAEGELTFQSDPAPLKCLYLLAPPSEALANGETTIERVSGHDAFVSLVKYAFMLDITDQGRISRQFTQISRLLEQVPLFRLSYPRDLSLLPAVCQAVRAHAEGLAPMTAPPPQTPH